VLRVVFVAVAIGLATIAVAAPARADDEAWLVYEHRMPVYVRKAFPRVGWRLIADLRLNRRSDGIHQYYFRTGPLLYFAPWFFTAIHGTAYADRLSSGAFDQEYRFEIEPTFQGRVGDFALTDRNRFEWRTRESGDRTRYRNQFRAQYSPPGIKWNPVVWDEALFDLTRDGFNQNRLFVGLARLLGGGSRIEAGLMARSRKEPAGWIHDAVWMVALLVDGVTAAVPK
jgi:hypothetical protein